MKQFFLKVFIKVCILICILIPGSWCSAAAQELDKEIKIYAETPEAYAPYSRFAEPYKRFFLVPNEYHGFGRHITEPESVEAVDIGFLGPIEKTVSVATGGVSHEEHLGRKMLKGAKLAVLHANEKGGFRGLGTPYRLVVKNDNGLWGSSANEVIDLAYRQKVRAILGTIDGANSHIAIRTALKAELPVMNSGNTDATYTETAIPWAFRCITDDRQMCYLMADFVFKKLKLTRVAALRANNRYGRIGIDEFRDAATRLGHPFIVELNYRVGDTDFKSQLQRIKALNPEAVVTFGDAQESAMILNQMRQMGLDIWFVGSDRLVSRDFIKSVDANLDKVAAGHPWNPKTRDEKTAQFQKAFQAQFGEDAETYAAHAYDGMSMIIQAIETAGLNRAKIRDELAEMKTYHGVSGTKRFDPIFNNLGSPFLALGREGGFDFLSKEDVLR